MAYSKEIVNLVEKFFAEDDWKYEFDDERGIFSGGVSGISGKLQNAKWAVLVHQDFLTTYVVLQINADEEVRIPVAEFLTRANYGLFLGCFEMDFCDGEIRYKMNTSLAELREDYCDAMRKALIIPCNMIERYSNGLLAVMFGQKSPVEAVKECKKSAD